MGEPENLDLHDFWIWGCGGPVGTMICGFEYTKLFLNIQETIKEPFLKMHSCKSET